MFSFIWLEWQDFGKKKLQTHPGFSNKSVLINPFEFMEIIISKNSTDFKMNTFNTLW